MALPGITKVREEAKQADREANRLEDRAEALRMDLVGEGKATIEQATAMYEAHDLAVEARRKADLLWERVSFMEDT